MKVAFIHDWLTGMRGGERCLETLLEIFPGADIYTVFYDPESVSDRINAASPVVSSLQRIPKSDQYYRHLLPLYPLAARELGNKLEKEWEHAGYDLVISISHCVAKNVPVPEGVFHLSYCLTPMRYVWDQYDAYFSKHRAERVIRPVARRLRRWDARSSSGVQHFVAISEFVKARINAAYRRQADVVYPPVRTDWISPRAEGEQGEGFLLANALVPYKNSELVIRAFNELREPLTVVGTGPELNALQQLAGKTIQFTGRISDAELAELYRRSRALVFAAEEDFGMIPVEMMAAGRPVIGLGQGGLCETVIPNKTGLLFTDKSSDAVKKSVRDFLDREHEFTVNSCVKQAQVFSIERFQRELGAVLEGVGFKNPVNEAVLEAGAERRGVV